MRWRTGVRKVEAVLASTLSPYLQPLASLRQSIDQGILLATENVKYLTILEAPCTALSKAGPQVGSVARSSVGVTRQLHARKRTAWAHAGLHGHFGRGGSVWYVSGKQAGLPGRRIAAQHIRLSAMRPCMRTRHAIKQLMPFGIRTHSS